MKFIYICVFSILLGVLPAKGSIQTMLKIIEECDKEFHISKEEHDKIFKEGIDFHNASETLKCNMKCIMEKEGVLKNGTFDIEQFVELNREAPMMKDHMADLPQKAEKCKHITNITDCETAFKLIECLVNNNAILFHHH
ncbi:general odorant-binding protein 56h-like [Haematobia irritans]|uniref:general odorant-binding protein 56h-like n=1 Tax=Haematobia irritans TaxID=7368 RepID=UPI003F4F3FF7